MSAAEGHRFFLAYSYHFRPGFTQTQTEAHRLIIDEAEAALVFTFRGRQDGPFMGIPPTQQEVVLPMVMIRQLKGGKS